jgi:hypothetical protein
MLVKYMKAQNYEAMALRVTLANISRVMHCILSLKKFADPNIQY